MSKFCKVGASHENRSSSRRYFYQEAKIQFLAICGYRKEPMAQYRYLSRGQLLARIVWWYQNFSVHRTSSPAGCGDVIHRHPSTHSAPLKTAMRRLIRHHEIVLGGFRPRPSFLGFLREVSQPRETSVTTLLAKNVFTSCTALSRWGRTLRGE